MSVKAFTFCASLIALSAGAAVAGGTATPNCAPSHKVHQVHGKVAVKNGKAGRHYAHRVASRYRRH
ncbi:hypothetical protein [Sagittula salina]|uniref:Uncharacterized protein n=1 Tax=Sagittula salina TaxID=2820268 RepID=A0A940MQ88_9RHOB|nr:hypothetical protein [Sagittula salina]MBP0483459.1 hypothetical protein [Sagittula salina]